MKEEHEVRTARAIAEAQDHEELHGEDAINTKNIKSHILRGIGYTLLFVAIVTFLHWGFYG